MSTSTGKSMKNSTAGIIIIGNEILRGQSQDTNSYFMTKRLHSLGVRVERVCVIPDVVDVIAQTVSEYSAKYTHVITSGGIGPTHDDCTYEGVAVAFGEELKPHPLLEKFIKIYFKTDDRIAAARKMAILPESAKLIFGEDKKTGMKSRFPTVSVKNVLIFPGIPRQLEKSFELLSKDLFYRPDVRFTVEEIFLDTDEVSIAGALNNTVAKFPHVQIGSYPKVFHSYFKTKITLQSLNSEDVKETKAYFEGLINPDFIVNYHPDPISDPWPLLESLPNKTPSLKSPMKEAFDTLEKCYKQYKPEEISVCFNGGKDCLVALHLAYAIQKKLYPDIKLQAVYIAEDDPFPQIKEFIEESINRYNLDCKILPGPLKSALETLSKESSIEAMIMGTRRTDPHASNFGPFAETDDDWPLIMRVHPLLSWQYDDIWKFIRGLCLPYCNLYDRGYTSLGGRNDTLPNPMLQVTSEEGDPSYLPAYRLLQPDHERKGRILSKH